MGSVADHLKHLQAQRAQRPIDEIPAQLTPAHPPLRMQPGQGAAFVQELLARKSLCALESQDVMPHIDPQDLEDLLQCVELAQQVFEERGLHTLCLTMGRMRLKGQEEGTRAAHRPLVRIPVFIRRGVEGQWELNWSGHPVQIDAQVRQDLDASPFCPEQATASYSQWWDSLCQSFAQCAELSAKYGLETEPMHIACISQDHHTLAQDLELERWGGAEPLASHPILSGLLGPGFLQDQRQSAFTDPYREGQEDVTCQNWIEDADQFQARAILAAASGENLLIQGPCGSGKTQTLTNILGELVARGKRVLLLSSSFNDLQAIENRLYHARLGHACLSSYDQRRPVKAVAMDLVNTLRLGPPKTPDRSAALARYQELHTQLNDYARAMREPLGASGWCYQEVVGRLLQTKQDVEGQGLPKLAFEAIAHWTPDDYRHAMDLVQSLADHIQEHGTLAASPYASLDLSTVTPENADEWCDRLAGVTGRVNTLLQSSETVFDELGLEPPTSFAQLGQWVRALSHLGTRPDLTGLNLDQTLWSARSSSAVELLTSGSLCASIKESHEDRLLDQAWQADLMELRGAWKDHGEKWWRKASRRWRQAQASLKGLTRGELPDEPEQSLALIDAVLHYQGEQATLQRLDAVGQELFASHWCGQDSDWDKLQAATDWLVGIIEQIQAEEIPAQFWSLLQHPTQDFTPAAELAQLHENLKEELEALQEELQISLCDRELEDLEESLTTWSEQRGALLSVLEYRTLEQELRGVGLSGLVLLAQGWSHPLDMMVPAVKLAYLRGLEALAFSERTQLRSATSVGLEAMRAEFAQLDRQLPSMIQEALNHQLFKRRPDPESAARLDLDADLQDPSVPSATLLATHWDAVTAIKPIILATPSSLTLLCPDPICSFDTVLIDSAGRMPLCDAMGGILRARQIIAVGDARQSPPPPGAREFSQANKGSDIINARQSVLYRCRAQGAQEYLLSTHYRSKHDSLISYVNEAFYDNLLRVAPSPSIASVSEGLYWHPSADSSVCTDHARGQNPVQAKAVAQQAARLLLGAPDQSLGILALSEGQCELIRQELERLQEEMPELHALLDPERDEPFFLHSIASVPREDRSTILLSLGYGVDAHGSVSSHWGILHEPDGHRMLSLALSRARARFHVFSNVEPETFEQDPALPTGLAVFAGFLAQARGSTQRIAQPGASAQPSSFALQVRQAITDLGFVVRSPTADHDVDADLYVYDPEHPDLALVGIICDTQRYHRQHVARDRERICADLLYQKGWKLHRVWCRDWLSDPEKETQKLAQTLRGLARSSPWQSRSQLAEPVSIETPAANLAAEHSGPHRAEIQRDYDPQAPALPFSLYRDSREQLPLGRSDSADELAHLDLQAAIERALTIEGPMHVDALSLRIAQSVGLFTSSPLLQACVSSAVDRSLRSNRVHREGAFISLEDQKALLVRNRCALPTPQKRLAWVPPVELDLALQQAAQASPQGTQEEILTGALEALGLVELDSVQRQGLQRRLEEMERAELLRADPLRSDPAGEQAA